MMNGLRSAAELAANRPHGIRLRYMAGCRCLKCRMANSNYETARARARKAGDWNGLVDAGPARLHLEALSRAGVGYKTAADAASVARSVVARIRTGERLKVRARTAKRLLSVTPDARADSSHVPAGPTWRLIRQLLRQDFTKARIARELGVGRALQFNRRRVLARTALAVEKLWRRYMQ